MKQTCYLSRCGKMLILLIVCGCQQDFLDIKPDKKQVVPRSLQDLQALLDNTTIMNNQTCPYLGEAGSDDYYMEQDRWQSLGFTPKNTYIWAKDLFEADAQVSDWNWSYRCVYYANTVLEGLDNLEPDTSDLQQRNQIKGQALFFRAWYFYQLAQLFCRPYNAQTADDDPGIPLRLSAGINESIGRASVSEVYQQILKDLSAAVTLLPLQAPVKTRPVGPAAHALLAKTYLLMGDYEKALQHAQDCLSWENTLISYSSLDTAAAHPFQPFNPEVIFHATILYTTPFLSSRLNVDTKLFSAYQADDLRRNIFFWKEEGKIKFRGSYSGSNEFFGGIATDEVYLIRAECYARVNQVEEALQDLNSLLSHRFKEEDFTPAKTTDPEEALRVILQERRKQLVFRGIRWSDLRRLNQDERFTVRLERELNGTRYTLEPNDPRYVLPIPQQVIELNGITQNPR